jgi:hypothetical protein
MPSNHIETANKILQVREFINELTRGGEYVPLFAHRTTASKDSEITRWLNAWLLTMEKKDELEPPTLNSMVAVSSVARADSFCYSNGLPK